MLVLVVGAGPDGNNDDDDDDVLSALAAFGICVGGVFGVGGIRIGVGVEVGIGFGICIGICLDLAFDDDEYTGDDDDDEATYVATVLYVATLCMQISLVD